MKNTFSILFAASVMTLLSACDKDLFHTGKSNSEYMDETDCAGQSPTYTTNIAPILNTQCAISGCHTAITPSHGLNLSGYNAAKNNFNAHSLICAISHDADCEPMPRNRPKLSDAEILDIICWAKNGFPQ